MSDQMQSFEPTDQPPAEAAPPGAGVKTGGIQGFLNSTTGKVVLGAVIGLLLLGVLAYVLFTFVLNKAGESPTGTVTVSTTTSTAQATTGTASTVPTTEAEAISLDDVFTFRDIFVPTINASDLETQTEEASESSSSSASSSSSSESNVLTLQAVKVENGKEVAVLTWNGKTYTLAEGESIPGTPWKVLSINGTTVVMLFGDQQVTLVVGEGVTK